MTPADKSLKSGLCDKGTAGLVDEPELGSRCQVEVSAAILPCLKTGDETGWAVCRRGLGTQWHRQSLAMLTFCAVREASVLVFSSTNGMAGLWPSFLRISGKAPLKSLRSPIRGHYCYSLLCEERSYLPIASI